MLFDQESEGKLECLELVKQVGELFKKVIIALVKFILEPLAVVFGNQKLI